MSASQKSEVGHCWMIWWNCFYFWGQMSNCIPLTAVGQWLVKMMSVTASFMLSSCSLLFRQRGWPLPKRLSDNQPFNPLSYFLLGNIFFRIIVNLIYYESKTTHHYFVGRYLYQSVRESSNKNEILCIWCRYCFHTSTERHLLNFRLYTIEIWVAVPIYLIN